MLQTFGELKVLEISGATSGASERTSRICPSFASPLMELVRPGSALSIPRCSASCLGSRKCSARPSTQYSIATGSCVPGFRMSGPPTSTRS